MSLYALPTLGPDAIDYCGHACARCRTAGRPHLWQHVLVAGRACPMAAVADCLACRRADMPGPRLAA